MTTVLKSKNRGRFFLILLMLVFIGPIIASYGLYYFRNYVPEILSNGTLILPPLDLNKLPLYDTQNQKITLKKFGGDWVMLYVEPEKCNKLCIDTLYKMRQIRIRLGKDMDRVKRVILTYQGFRDNALNEYLKSLYKGTLHIQTPGSDLNNFLAKLPPHDRAIKTGHLYLVDPLGNVMMSYELSQKPKDIYSDMKRLLKASRIG
jgi:cytochrome oxidase Cu insertion factor (SCO1/SenC/PrrC family)